MALPQRVTRWPLRSGHLFWSTKEGLVVALLLWPLLLWSLVVILFNKATSNKCIATSNKCLTTSNKKLLETRS